MWYALGAILCILFGIVGGIIIYAIIEGINNL